MAGSHFGRLCGHLLNIFSLTSVYQTPRMLDSAVQEGKRGISGSSQLLGEHS